MTEMIRNNLTIYDDVAAAWWSDDIRWVRTLKNLVPARLAWFDRQIGWAGKRVLDLGCAGGFMAEALDERGAEVTGIDPAAEAIGAARAHAARAGRAISYDVGVGEDLPYEDQSFDAVVCVDVLEHVRDLRQVMAEVARVLEPGGLFLFDTINRNPLARLATITVAEDILRLLPMGTHDPEMFIKPEELRAAMAAAGLEPGPFTGLGPRGLNRRGDITFGRLPLTAILYMGTALKPAGPATSRS
ncbi:bifunctional 2-polyprenyl-6-hydroxyphenol methylase/3-demethylubiquinol 3-O-methyltransferase UbiG [Ovoidimarina sediminis]|uniref:bifunctional 2-polyprenyl-6-hydroxyphenol methylase/3-demethylubiquinol 3-O-methyltransferase UbiG n=1 Tax=Ovoidimarina sediminis TaxID=3079856 RepID=UPI00290AA760|nr:bifunctional 2-polyprenyl-6-hydroxyphenol methylase/3-demethylubiquinol 3-O-methyltransferase UbiG [Rhodophyticola sp. MJ-SS7]MDU8944436.1 bifunctional 2-polyprenyl-6-hydroxyphenol methylase/3-demethylubiquinol 3-O-methyltransferase UbiG [Rhodophyticola sp. MJ-SS7]